MPALSRSALSASPLADLHLLAAELGLDGYRRLRKPELIDRILERQGGGEAADAPEEAPEVEEKAARPRRSRRRSTRDADSGDSGDGDTGQEPQGGDESASRGRDAEPDPDPVEGPVKIQPGGSALIAVEGGDDVYLSAAQVRRCELVEGDRVSGPVRAARRSERHPSLIRVEQINGRPADEVAAGTPYEELACEPPAQRFELPGALAPVAEVAPIGRGSRVTVTGPAFAGKSTMLRQLAEALGAAEGLDLAVVLAGSRPEERGAWVAAGIEPHAVVALPAAPDARARAVETAVDAGRRKAARGDDAAVLIDSLDGLDRGVARRALGAARNITGGGSLTVIATASAPVGGETAIIALQRGEAGPSVDRAASGAYAAELL